MEEQCLVLSSDWVCGDGGKWDEGIGCEELERNLMLEFRVDKARFGVSLSY